MHAQSSESQLKASSEKEQAQGFKQKGNEDFKNKNYSDAILNYSQAIVSIISSGRSNKTFQKLDPSVSIYFSNRARCYLQNKQYAKTETDSLQAISLDDKNIKAYYILGIARCELGKILSDRLTLGIQNLKRGKFILFYLTSKIAHQLCIGQQKRTFENSIETIILRAKKIAWYQKEQLKEQEKKQIKVKLVDILNQSNNGNKQDLLKQVEKYFGPQQNLKRKVPDYFQCRITMNIMRDPVILQSGFTYEKEAILMHFSKYGYSDPVTRKKVTNQLVPNINLKQAIQEFVETQVYIQLFLSQIGILGALKRGKQMLIISQYPSNLIDVKIS